MSSEFVRYAPEIETIDPHLDEPLAQIIDFVEKKGRESLRTEGAGRAVRAAHAKSFGLVKAEVEIQLDAPAAYAQGIYAKPSRHGALIHFSSTSGHLGTDAQLGTGLGLLHPHPSKRLSQSPDCASPGCRRTTQSLKKPLNLRTPGESHLCHTHIRGDVDSRRTQ
jgi:hypothetical protein